ncbi:MAG: hemerythrin domain-containing protein [Stellaceae bacterium]
MPLLNVIDKSRRKIGAALSSDGRAMDDHDVLDTLKQDHEEVSDLLDQLVDSESASGRASLLKRVKAALVPHSRAEEKTVYDPIRALKGKQQKQDGEEGYLEHALADKMLDKLGRITKTTSPEFSAAAKVLKELIAHHVAEEERNIWRDVRDNFSDEERLAMNRRFEAAKARVRVG